MDRDAGLESVVRITSVISAKINILNHFESDCQNLSLESENPDSSGFVNSANQSPARSENYLDLFFQANIPP